MAEPVNRLNCLLRVVALLKPDPVEPTSTLRLGSARVPISADPDVLEGFGRYFPDPALARSVADGALSSVQERLARYHHRTFDPGDEAAAEELVRRLISSPRIEAAYVESRPVDPVFTLSPSPTAGEQGYLDDAAHMGIGAAALHALNIRGTGVGFVDVERGWLLTHQELKGRVEKICGFNRPESIGHGTKVLGIVSAANDKRGVVGIASEARVRVVSTLNDPSDYSVSRAIGAADEASEPGDVILIEEQTLNGLPVELDSRANFDKILAATERGIIVVEPAGNGRQPLDDRMSANPDSGAILVGAARTSDWVRAPDSNYGKRVNCFAWGDTIATCGTKNNETNQYDHFSGTSGAAAIVAGAAILLQSWAKEKLGKTLLPAEVRQYLSHPAWNTHPKKKDQGIGVMPNLVEILRNLGR